MHHAIIRPTSPRSPTLDTVDSSKTWHQTGPYDLESASAASQTRTVFTLPAWEESRDKQANDQTVMVGTGPSHSERQSLEAVQTIETEERTEDDSARERADHQQSAPQYASSSRYSSFSDKSVRDGQQQGVYRLENIRLHYVSTEAAEQDATAMGAQTSEIQDQSKRRDVLFGLWNEISCDFAAKARLLRFDSRLAESSRAPLAVALDQSKCQSEPSLDMIGGGIGIKIAWILTLSGCNSGGISLPGRQILHDACRWLSGLRLQLLFD